MESTITLRKGRQMRCETCGQEWSLEHRAIALKDDDGGIRLAQPTPCPNGHVAGHPVAGGWGGGRLGAGGPYKGDRIQSTMRYDEANHKFVSDLAHETGLSFADLVNEFIRVFRVDAGLRNAAVERLSKAEDED